MSLQLPSYAYNASAIGLGGMIRQGNRTTIIPTVASVCLATAGGEGSNLVENYDRDGISFTRAWTHVSGFSTGRGDGARHETTAEVHLLNLRIFDRLSIARMFAVVRSTRDLDRGTPTSQLAPDQTRFSIQVRYHGVEIDGEEIDFAVDDELCESSTYRKFTELMTTRKPTLLESGQRVLEAQEALVPAAPPISGPLLRIRGLKRARANRIMIPAFGHARFGDLIVKQDRQRVSLLRINLDETWSPKRNASNGGGSPLAFRTVSAEGGDVTTDGAGDSGGGGAVTSGDSGSNGVPIWEGA